MDATIETGISQYISIVRQRWLWALVGLTCTVGAAVFLASQREPSYESTAVVLLRALTPETLNSGNANPSLLSRGIANEMRYAQSDVIRSAVGAELGTEIDIDVTGDITADLLLFSATANSAEESALHANAWARAYVDQLSFEAAQRRLGSRADLEVQLEALRISRREIRAPAADVRRLLANATGDLRRSQLEQQLSSLEDEALPDLAIIDAEIRFIAEGLAEVNRGNGASVTDSARIINSALPPDEPTGAPLSQIAALAAVVGGFVGVTFAFLRDALDNRIHSERDVRLTTGLPTLAQIPEDPRKKRRDIARATMDDPDGPVADGYNALRSALHYIKLSTGLRSVLVTSSTEGEGKTVTSANLAWSMASLDQHKVVLIDGDFRRPQLHEVYRSDNSIGFTKYAFGDHPLVDVVIRASDESSEMVVLTTGPLPPQPSDLIVSDAFRAAFEEIVQEEAFTVIDSPPVLPVSDALTLSEFVDGVLIVVRAKKTKKSDLLECLRRLETVGATIIGVVLVGASGRSGSYWDYGGSTLARRSSEAVIELGTATAAVPKPRSAHVSGAT